MDAFIGFALPFLMGLAVGSVIIFIVAERILASALRELRGQDKKKK